MAATSSGLFWFDQVGHRYTDGAGAVPHITGMLERTGWVNDLWFTEESSERGTEVHKLTASYDLEALDLESCETPFRGYLLAHVRAMQILRPEFATIEQPVYRARPRFAGRPDRAVLRFCTDGRCGPLELKTAAPAKSHPIQTALQAILLEELLEVPAEMQARWCLYLKATGRFSLVEHTHRGDFDVAREILRSCTT